MDKEKKDGFEKEEEKKYIYILNFTTKKKVYNKNKTRRWKYRSCGSI